MKSDSEAILKRPADNGVDGDPEGLPTTDRVPYEAALGDRIRPQRTWPREGGETCYFH